MRKLTKNAVAIIDVVIGNGKLLDVIITDQPTDVWRLFKKIDQYRGENDTRTYDEKLEELISACEKENISIEFADIMTYEY